MRELKFRAWDIKGEGYIAGFNLLNYHDYFNKGLKKSIERYNASWPEGEYILEQSTGLHDSEGKEIFEGDLWERDRFLAKVEFVFSSWNFTHLPKSNSIQYPNFYSNASSGKIIGNVNQNPELLKNP